MNNLNQILEYYNKPNISIIFTAEGEEAFKTITNIRHRGGSGREMFKRHWKRSDKSDAYIIIFIEYTPEKVPIKIGAHYYHTKDGLNNPLIGEGDFCMFDTVPYEIINTPEAPKFLVKLIKNII